MSDQGKIAKISHVEYWMGRHREFPPNLEVRSNVDTLLNRVNSLLLYLKFPSPVFVSSGYRPGHFNQAAGGARRSGHITGSAVDLADADRRLTDAISAWPAGPDSLLRLAGLWMESPSATPTWVHLDTISRPGPRIFKP
jgi:hypothetical protein